MITIRAGLKCLSVAVVVAVSGGCLTGPRPASTVKPYRPDRPVVMAAKPVPKAGNGVTAQGEAATSLPAGSTLVPTERVLRKGDRVQVTIYVPPEPFTGPNVVDEGGRINFPLIGSIVVAGKSCGDAQRDVEKAYIDQKIYKTVTVVIVPPESEYAVAGEVIRPGPYPLTRDLTLLQALARSGRYTEYADKSRVMLRRGNESIEIKLEPIREGKTKDITIIPGDVIEVPRSIW